MWCEVLIDIGIGLGIFAAAIVIIVALGPDPTDDRNDYGDYR